MPNTPPLKVTLADRIIDGAGGTSITIEVTTVDNTTLDSMGKPSETIAQHTMNGVLSYSRRVIKSETAMGGRQETIETEIYVKDADFDDTGIGVPLDVDSPRPVVIVGSNQYEVIETEQPGFGLTRLVTRKQR